MPIRPCYAVAALVVALLGVCTAEAQVTHVSGTVTLKQVDGEALPVSGAIVDLYRTDINGRATLKTDRKGQYNHPHLAFVGTYTVVVSAAGAQPAVFHGCRFSRRPELDAVLEPGDGRRPSLGEARTEAGRPCSDRSGSPGAADRLEGVDSTSVALTSPVPISLASLFDAGRVDETIAESGKVLAVDPRDIEANLYLGLALFVQRDEAQFEEAASYLARFLDKAPAGHPRAEAAKTALDDYRSRLPAPVEAAPPKPSRRR